jgi:hypothetical protein
MADFTKQHVQNLFAQLKLLNVNSFEIEFDGSGDSGQIEGVTFYDTSIEVMDIPEDTISWVYTAYGQEPKDTKVTIHKAVEDLGYQMLEESGHDWYNNEGGYGRISVHMEGSNGKPYVGMNMNIRIVNEDHYEYGNDNFTMFAEEGKHKKTDSRQNMDKFMSHYALEKIPQQELINEDK